VREQGQQQGQQTEQGQVAPGREVGQRFDHGRGGCQQGVYPVSLVYRD
jgi:hypothetical protein